nr:hypothetical protein BaRGS_018616 [Batillaria attramentaria]
MFGGATVFMLLASQNLQLVVAHLFHKDLSFCVWLLVLAGILIPCTWPGTPKDFWPVAVGAMTATSLACIVLVVAMAKDPRSVAPVVHREVDLLSFAMAFGTIAFSSCGHPWLALRTMDRETRVRIPAEASGIFPTKVGFYPERVCYGPSGEAVATQPSFTHFTVMAAMYLSVAITGYYVYGQNVKENVLQTVSAGTPLLIVELLITGHLVCSYIIVINPVCQEVEDIIGISKSQCRYT